MYFANGALRVVYIKHERASQRGHQLIWGSRTYGFLTNKERLAFQKFWGLKTVIVKHYTKIEHENN